MLLPDHLCIVDKPGTNAQNTTRNIVSKNYSLKGLRTHIFRNPDESFKEETQLLLLGDGLTVTLHILHSSLYIQGSF